MSSNKHRGTKDDRNSRYHGKIPPKSQFIAAERLLCIHRVFFSPMNMNERFKHFLVNTHLRCTHYLGQGSLQREHVLYIVHYSFHGLLANCYVNKF